MNKLIFLLLLFLSLQVAAQKISYPFPVQYLNLVIEGKPARMAYMHIEAAAPNGKTVLLFHGKNFNGYYWKEVMAFLSKKGYGVVVPDQVGWGLSDKPEIHYSFHLLAFNTKKLLDTLNIQKVQVIGHSMGGMLAARFSLMYPGTVEKIILENPIGLEDYRTFVPYRPLDSVIETELKSNHASIKKYQQTYYPVWKPEYEQYVTAQYMAQQIPDSLQAATASAISSQMIYEQPVVYEFRNIPHPALIIIGQEDRTVVGKNLLSKEEAVHHGQYPQLGKWLKSQMKNSTLIELPGVGHIPHIQELNIFQDHVLRFLKRK